MQENESIDAATISQVMSMIGSKKTAKKTGAAIANLEAGRKRLSDPDVRQVLSDKQKARRERERQEREAAGLAAPVEAAEKKKPGRPRKQEAEPAGEKRGRGRPKKQDGQTTAQTATASHNGTGEAKTA